MMNFVNLGEETETLEYKKSTGELKEAVQSICAILNKHGQGELYFGVKNNGDVIGQDISDSTLRDVSRAIRNHIKPMIYPEIEKKKLGGRNVIYVRFKGDRQPYLAYEIPRIRIADEDVVMGQDEYDDMLRKRDDFTKAWESRVSEYKVSDIDEEVLKNYLRKAKEAGRITFDSEKPRDVMEKLGLLSGEYLINAGAVLFCDKPLNEVQMAKFASNERITFTDIRKYVGSILDLADKGEQYIIDAMDWRAEIVGLRREETPEIPVSAIREAIINAFAHRQVESGQSVEISVYKNRIEIYSPSSYASPVEPETYVQEERESVRRNPIITRTLYYSKDMETFATGFKRIQRACDDAGCIVEYEKRTPGFVVVFHRNLREGWNLELRQDIPQMNSKALKLTKKAFEEALKQRLIEIVKNDPSITQLEIAGQLDISRTKVQRIIKDLIDEERLERTGGKRFGKWKIIE